MFQCVIVEEIIMLSSILLSRETFYRNSVQLLHFHLSNCHFQKKHVQYRKSIKEQQIDFLFPLNLDCIKLCDSCDICDSCDSCVTAKGFFAKAPV